MRNRSKGAVELSRRKKRGFFVGAAVFINSYLLLSFFFGDMGMLKAVKLKRTHTRLHQEIVSLKQENEKLAGRITALKSDPDAIESLARQRLGLAREGELIYEFYESNP